MRDFFALPEGYLNMKGDTTIPPDMTVCHHPRCGLPVVEGHAKFKTGLPFHPACFYAHPTHDVTKGCGSPFAEITGPAGVTTGAST
jgi:hypothetical protein